VKELNNVAFFTSTMPWWYISLLWEK